MKLNQSNLFTAGQKGYHTFRIPALVVTTEGTLLAFAEGRKAGRGDAGEIDLVLKRSFDNGATWQPLQVVVTEPAMTCGNPCPVVDHNTNTIWLPFCKNLADGDENLITQGKAPRTVWVTHSADDGATWAEPTEITAAVKDPTWTWYATGPTHGIQLQDGRLLVPCDHMVGKYFDRKRDPYHSHVIYSDDHGASWQIGGIVDDGTNECAVVELVDGTIYINCRNYVGDKRRAVAWSQDRGESFAQFRWDSTLIEPICQASLVRASDDRQHGRTHILFANPASTAREKLTVRLSYDECQSWPVARRLHDGPAAYSDLAVTPDGMIHCLYERGDEHPYEALCLARFDLAWLTEGQS
ncbi:MAG TPA: sialidase family protein [Caldilineaceae bacterium]|nr:sialidase family protein [Caldilineaceae bacterium]